MIDLCGKVCREGRTVSYASGNFGKALVFGSADLTILYLLTDVLDIPGRQAASLMLMAVLGDLLFDLLAARLVIRWRTSGRGYRWAIAAAALPCGTAFALIYAMPLLGVTKMWFLAAAILTFRGAYALVDVPHNALMAQVVTDSRARGRVSGYRLLFSTASALAIATIVTPLVQQAGGDGRYGALALTGIAVASIFTLTMLLCSSASTGIPKPHMSRPLTDGIVIPLCDPMVLAMGALGLLTGFAASAFGRMLLYIGSYVVEKPGVVTGLLTVMSLGQFCGVLTWTALNQRFSKTTLLCAGHAVSLIGLTMFGLSLHWPIGTLAAVALIGFGFASVFMLPWGLLADAVDVVEWRSGRRFETGLFAFYLVAVKASGAACAATIGWALGALGYMPGQVQSDGVRWGMVMIGLGLPITGAIASILLLGRFRLNHARHDRLMRAIHWRHMRQGGADPVSGSNLGLAKSSGEGDAGADDFALSAQARQSMSRTIAAPAAVRS